jgi:hypothetical protein
MLRAAMQRNWKDSNHAEESERSSSQFFIRDAENDIRTKKFYFAAECTRKKFPSVSICIVRSEQLHLWDSFSIATRMAFTFTTVLITMSKKLTSLLICIPWTLVQYVLRSKRLNKITIFFHTKKISVRNQQCIFTCKQDYKILEDFIILFIYEKINCWFDTNSFLYEKKLCYFIRSFIFSYITSYINNSLFHI